MEDERDFEEEESTSLPTPKEIIDRHRFQQNQIRANGRRGATGNPNLEKALKKKTIKSGVSSAATAAGVPVPVTEGVMSSPLGDDLIDYAVEQPTIGAGIATIVQALTSRTWLFIVICSSSIFFFLFIIIIVFLLKNSDSLNYASGNFLDSEEYRKIYDEVEDVVDDYRDKYGVTVDKYLIISALTAYQGNEMYQDDTESSAFDIINVEDDSGAFSKSVTEMKNFAEILAKYQVKTTTSCSYDSSTMRSIASNDDSTSIFNFWTSAAAKEKNYDCSGSSSYKNYSISIEEGNIDDDDSGSTFYWNLVDEDFLKQYYDVYFENLSDEVYEKTAADTIEYIYLYAETLKTFDTTNTTVTACNGTSHWWPIGSNETQEKNGVLFASGNPVSATITATFSGDDSVHNGSHGALDIAAGGNPYIIASKAGTVIYPNNLSQTKHGNGFFCKSDGTCLGKGCTSNKCAVDKCGNYGSGYGNYVMIEHSDGSYTVYGHMLADSITVTAGEKVAQGQVIGKMGTSGCSTGDHLHFEIRIGGNSSSNGVDPEKYVSKDNPRGGCGDFSLTETSLSKQEFISLMKDYCQSSKNQPFCTNFADQADVIYDSSVSNKVNPELVVVTAGTEQEWKTTCGYNFWKIGIPKGAECDLELQPNTMEEGIIKYATVIHSYLQDGSHADTITARYNERRNAGCDPSGHGLPGTLAGMQSVYSELGNYRYNPGDEQMGGCEYLNIIYGSDYCSNKATCPSPYSGCSDESKTTICEQNDYTIFQLKEKIELRQEIFGL